MEWTGRCKRYHELAFAMLMLVVVTMLLRPNKNLNDRGIDPPCLCLCLAGCVSFSLSRRLFPVPFCMHVSYQPPTLSMETLFNWPSFGPNGTLVRDRTSDLVVDVFHHVWFFTNTATLRSTLIFLPFHFSLFLRIRLIYLWHFNNSLSFFPSLPPSHFDFFLTLLNWNFV